MPEENSVSNRSRGSRSRSRSASSSDGSEKNLKKIFSYIKWVYKVNQCKNGDNCLMKENCFNCHPNEKEGRRRQPLFKKEWNYDVKKSCDCTNKECKKWHNEIEKNYHPLRYKTKQCDHKNMKECEKGIYCWMYHHRWEERNPKKEIEEHKWISLDKEIGKELKPGDCPNEVKEWFQKMKGHDHSNKSLEFDSLVHF
ncbi:hypothetical protein RFI_16227 [Reticulomyxa filosa]|uniref:C3H1-type domain-containing protein n=1 Tax=Reticulomyxa filosa TaxID=46433 RepID=X6N4P1_RETFI|nr:hypothetical protein RFI_16227 [Reticulomyxa filosa]|eukprot:ETO20976.1 hypothetical protein RFI_16227 [Reticulomyxa filosa]